MYLAIQSKHLLHFLKRASLISFPVAGIYLVFWPTLISGLDSHHDGLVITTINMTKEALFHGGDLPFNQYGPTWSFIYAIVSLPFSSSYTLIVARIITLAIYILTFSILRKITKILKVANLWPTVLIVLLLTQPWTTGYGTTFLAWPSALTALLLTLTVYLVLQIHEGTRVKLNLNFLGVLSAFSIFTRFQIGVASLFLCIAFVLSLRNLRDFSRFAMNFFLIFLSFSGFLYLKGWFGYFIFDDVLYAITYVQDKYSVNPFPRFTILFTLIAFFFLVVIEKYSRKNPLRQRKSFIYADIPPVLASTLLITALILVSQRFEDLFMLTMRRAWIGGILGLALYYALQILINFRHLNSFSRLSRIQIWLFLFGGIGMIQLYPLFDQVHFWWGLSPLVIPLSILIVTLLNRFLVDVRKLSLLTLILFGTTTILVPSIQAGFARTEPYAGNVASLIHISPEANSERKELQTFFRDLMGENPRVLNLCHNPDVFFSPSFAKSSSRYFIYWPPFASISKINREVLASNPEFVVTCSQTQVPAAAADIERSQQQLLRNLKVDFKSSQGAFISGTSWNIYKR